MDTSLIINNPLDVIGLFRRDITPMDRLSATTVGRREMLDDLVEKLTGNIGKRGGQHFIFIGPRGIGKTHFLSLLETIVQNTPPLDKSYTVIRFPEESNRILSFADFLLGVIEILGEVTQQEEWQQLHISLFDTDRDEIIIDSILPRLKHYQKQTGRTLLILLENLDVVFGEQIKKENQIHQFRGFLMDSPCATLVGTSPVYFSNLYNVNSPLYDFFDIQILEDLTEKQTLSLIYKNLEWDKRHDLVENFPTLKAKIRALHTLTGGNPRLIMMLYHLIAHDNLLEVKVQFQQLLDQISPFYQHRLKDLAPQERALLETMAIMRTTPRTPANIARQLRKSPQQTSSLLKRMTKAGYLVVIEHPDDKRSKLYRIKEGFFDIWLAMSESRAQRKYLAYLVDFFENWYRSLEEREEKRQELWRKIDDEAARDDHAGNNLEMLGYMSEVGGNQEKTKAKIELAVHSLKRKKAGEALDFIKEVSALSPERSSFIWMTEQAGYWAEGKVNQDIRQWLEEMIEYWQFQRTGDLERAAMVAAKLGHDFSDHGLHCLNIELKRDSLNHTTDSKKRIELYLNMAKSQEMDGQLSEALDSLTNVLAISREVSDRTAEGLILNNISQIYKVRGDYDTALGYLKQSLKIHREIGNRAGFCATLFNIAHIHLAKKENKQAMEAFVTVYKLAKEIGEAKVLAMLEKIAGDDGLAFWEKLASSE